MVPQDEIDAEGLTLVGPKRKKRRTLQITINYLRQKDNEQKLTITRKPGSRQKRKLLALAISVGVKQVMSNHLDAGKILFSEQEVRTNEQEDARVARLLKDIANEVQEGIEMEAEFPSNDMNGKMAILDMSVWMDSDNNIVYEHYQKSVASKQILSAHSVQSTTCKRSVHVQEVLRRILNNSTGLDWDKSVAPVLTEYMKRMQQAGYDEKFRKNVLRIHDKMRDDPASVYSTVLRKKY